MEADTTEIRRLIINLHTASDPQICSYILIQIQEKLHLIHVYPNASQVLEIVFNEKNGILGSIRRNIGEKSFDKGKEEAYAIIKGLLSNQKIEKNLLIIYVVKFKDVINTSWKNSRESAKVQNAALECLTELLQNYGSLVNFADMDACNLYQTLLVSSERKMFASSVRGNMLHLLGILAYSYNDKILNKPVARDQLLKHLISTIRSQVESKTTHLEAVLLLGAIRSVDHFLKAYGRNCAEIQTLYNCLEQIVNPKISIAYDREEPNLRIKRKGFQRASLTLIANHGSLFKQFLYKSHTRWLEDLITWARSSNSEDSSVGRNAIFTFLKVICTCLNEVQSDEQGVKLRQDVITHFTTKFLQILENKEATKADLSIAIRGIGLIFTVSLDPKLKEQLVTKVFMQIENLTEDLKKWRYSPGNYASLHLIAISLDCIGDLLLAVEIPDEAAQKKFEVRLLLVEQLSVFWLKYYANLSRKYKDEAEVSFLKVLRSIYSKHNLYFRNFVDNVFSEGLTHMIAAPPKTEVQQKDKDQNNDGKDVDNDNQTEKKKPKFEILAPMYFHCWISLVKSAMTAKDSSFLATDLYDSCIQWALSTINKLDLSLVPFDDDDMVIEKIDDISDPASLLKPNIPKDHQLFGNLVDFLQVFIPKTDLAFVFKWIPIFMSEISSYITTCPYIGGFYRIVGTIFNAIQQVSYFQSEDGLQNNTIDACSKFLESLGIKVREFRDDLLLSVLEVWLSAPDELILKGISDISKVLHPVFTIGQTNLPLTLKGITAIERWLSIELVPLNFKEDLFSELLPLWMEYFSVDDGFKTDISVKLLATPALTYPSNHTQTDKTSHESSLEIVQSRLLQLIGCFKYLYKLENSRKSDSTQIMIEQKLLSSSIQFNDTGPDLYLDGFLPRILYLCSSVSDKQIRISACECFRSLVLYFVENSTEFLSFEKHEELFRKIFFHLIKLGSDSDLQIRQLFNPLVAQVIQCYANKTQSYDAMMIQILVDGLAQYENVPLREFSSVSFGEYFSWTLKCTNSNKESNSDKLIETICELSAHAEPNYRQAAVLAFNCIYKDFSLNQNLINRYSFQLIHALISSLCLSSEYGPDSVLIKSTQQSIQQLERIILQNVDLFNATTTERKQPTDLTSTCLKNLVDWIFKKSVDSKTNYGREECLRLVSVLAPLISATVLQYLESFEATLTQDGFLELVEGKLIAAHTQSKQKPVEQLLTWIPTFEETLTLYKFLSESGYSTEKLVLLSRSKFIRSIDELLHRVSFEQFTHTFILDIGKILSNTDFNNLFAFRTEHMFLVSSIRESGRMKDHQQLTELIRIWEVLWERDNYHDECRAEFIKTYDFNLSEKKFAAKDAIITLCTVDCLRVIAGTKFLRQIMSENEISDIKEKYWSYIDSQLFHRGEKNSLQSQRLPAHIEKLLRGIMSLIVELDQMKSDYTNKIFDSEEVTFSNGRVDEKVTKGDLFQDVMLPALLDTKNIFQFRDMTFLVKLEKIGSLITKLIKIVKERKAFKEKYASVLVTNVTIVWQQIQLNFEPQIVSRILNGLITLDPESTRISKNLSNWWADLMTNSQRTIQEKSLFIEFLNFFGNSSDSEVQATIFKAVEKLSQQDWTKDWVLDEDLVSKLIQAVILLNQEITGNLNLLTSLTTFFMKIIVAVETTNGQDQPSTALISNDCFVKLQDIFVSLTTSMPETALLPILDNIYKLIKNGIPIASLSLHKYCLIPFLSHLPELSMKTFFLININYILKSAQLTPSSQGEWMLKTAAFWLIEVLALRTSKNFLKGAELNQVYISSFDNPPSPVTGNELVKALMSVWASMKTSAFTPAEDTKNIQFKCMVAGYNAINALLVALNHEEKFFNGFLFVERNDQKVWERIIDCSIEVSFSVIPEANSDGINSSVEGNSQPSANRTMSKSLVSNLNNSSLGMEAIEFDFSFIGEVNPDALFEPYTRNDSRLPVYDRLQVSIENNSILNHESIRSLTRTVRYLDKLNNNKNGAMKDWMKQFLNNLQNPATHANVKLFTTVLIVHCEDVFRKFASVFLEPLLGIIVNGLCRNAPTETSSSLNYFERNLIHVLLSWKDLVKPSVEMSEKVFNYVLPKVEYSRKEVTKQNLELITEMTRAWISTTLPALIHTTIVQYLDKPDPTVALAVMKHIILGGVLPCPEEHLVQFIKKVSKSLQSSLKAHYEAAAEVLGLLIKLCKESDLQHLSHIVGTVRKYLVAEKSRAQPFVIMLIQIGLTYPPLVISFKSDLLSFLKNKEEVRRDALDLLVLATMEELENASQNKTEVIISLFNNFEQHFFKIECCDDHECSNRVKLLSMFLRTDYRKEYDKLSQLLTWVKKGEESRDPKLRLDYATVLSTMYRLIFELKHDSKSDLLQKIEISFIRLYKDEDETVQRVAHNFWARILESWLRSPFLLLELLEKLAINQQCVSVILDLMIKRCSMSPDFAKLLLNQPLSNLQSEVSKQLTRQFGSAFGYYVRSSLKYKIFSKLTQGLN